MTATPPHDARWFAVAFLGMWSLLSAGVPAPCAAPPPLTARLDLGRPARQLGSADWKPDRDCGQVRFSPDERTIASFRQSTDAVLLWSVPAGRRQVRLDAPAKGILDGAFINKGKGFRAVFEDRSVVTWDLASGRCEVKGLKGKVPIVRAALFAEAALLVTEDRPGAVEVWDCATGERRHRVGAFEKARLTITALAVSPKGGRIALAREDGSVILCDSGKGAIRRWSPDGAPVDLFSLRFRDERTLVIGGGSGEVGVLDWERPTYQPLPRAGERAVLSLAFSPNGRFLAAGSGEGALTVWDIEKRTKLGRRMVEPVWGVAGVEFAPSGRMLACGGFVLHLFEAPDLTPLTTHSGHVGPVTGVAVRALDGTVASASRDGTVGLWDGRSGKLRTSIAHRGVMAVAFSGAGDVLASSGSDGAVRLWDPTSGKLLRALPGHKGNVFAVAFAPDGRLLASAGDDDTVRLWDTRTGKEKQALRGHKGGVLSLAFAPSGGLLASGGYHDRTVRVWTPLSEGPPLVLREAGPTVTALAFSPDARFLVAGNEDGEAVVWELASGSLLLRRRGHPSRILAASLSTAGGPATVVSEAGVTCFWLLPLSMRAAAATFASPAAAASLVSRSRLVVARADTVIDVYSAAKLLPPPWPKALTPGLPLQRAWEGLLSPQASLAYQSALPFLASPEASRPFLERQLRPVPDVPREAIRKLIKQLGEKDFEVRRAAEAKLSALGELADTCFEEMLRGPGDLEVRARVARLLEDQWTPSRRNALRLRRAVLLLERDGSQAAVRLLRLLSTGAADSAVTRDARTALLRIGAQSRP